MYKIPLNKSTLGKDDLDAANEVLYSDRLTMGPRVEAFEKMFAEYVGAKHAVMVNSGSSANLLAVFALDHYIYRGDMSSTTVTVPALTWSTTVWPIIQCGFTPKFLDCDIHTLQTPEADFTVHLLGNASIKKGEYVIEDCCESLGVYIGTKHVGTNGLAGTFSFYFSHHITTIEGGMITTNDPEFADLLRSMRSHGWARSLPEDKRSKLLGDSRFLMINPGFNLRPTEINGALGLTQLPKLENFNKRRREIFNYVKSETGFHTMQIPEGVMPAPFAFPILNEQRDKLQKYLEDSGIETRPIICGNLLRHPAFSKWKAEVPHANKVHKNGLYFSLSPMMTDEDVDYIVEILNNYED